MHSELADHKALLIHYVRVEYMVYEISICKVIVKRFKTDVCQFYLPLFTWLGFIFLGIVFDEFDCLLRIYQFHTDMMFI